MIDTTKTELENRLMKTEKNNAVLREKVSFMEKKLDEIHKFIEILYWEIGKRG